MTISPVLLLVSCCLVSCQRQLVYSRSFVVTRLFCHSALADVPSCSSMFTVPQVHSSSVVRPAGFTTLLFAVSIVSRSFVCSSFVVRRSSFVVCLFVRSFIRSFVASRTSLYSFVVSLVGWLVGSFVASFVGSFVASLTSLYSFVRSFVFVVVSFVRS